MATTGWRRRGPWNSGTGQRCPSRQLHRQRLHRRVDRAERDCVRSRDGRWSRDAL